MKTVKLRNAYPYWLSSKQPVMKAGSSKCHVFWVKVGGLWLLPPWWGHSGRAQWHRSRGAQLEKCWEATFHIHAYASKAVDLACCYLLLK